VSAEETRVGTERAIIEASQDVAVQIDYVYVPDSAFSGVMRVTLQAG
jgi:hypothetical protein